ncbi:MAG: GSCFA domain-containing protein [Bacteroidota bacterium]
MQLQSTVSINEPSKVIRYNDKLIFLGSCFSGNIGNKFVERLFDTTVNPFGVIFNPVSIFKLLDRSIDKRYFVEDDWQFFNEKWINLDLHGDLSYYTLEEALEKSNNLIDEMNEHLNNATHLFLTFGTAWIYEYIEKQQLVANCHKIPQKEFEKRLLSVEEIVESGNAILSKLQTANSGLQTIFTISPVRHLADGAHNNNISKSALFLAVDEMIKESGSDYFPSYEIVMDELRDYRFFDRDFMHPNQLATDYVWERLLYNWVGEDTVHKVKKVEKVIAAANHRPFNVESEAHQKFLRKNLSLIKELSRKARYLNFDSIKRKFKEQLN